MIISIDGPAGSGKSTVAEALSQKLGFIHFNSGTLYRAVCCYLLDAGLDVNSLTPDSKIRPFKLSVSYAGDVQKVLVNGMDYSAHFRDNNISILTPIISTNKYIRNIIDNCQRKFFKTHNLVVEGRDIGSFVYPNAEFKFYLDCSVKERARRRYLEEKQKNTKITLKEIENQLLKRDKIDKSKPYAPLVVPENAIIIDSTHLTIDAVVNKMLKIIKK